MIEKIVPLEDRLIIEVEKKERTEAGLFLPDSGNQDKVIRGKVIAAGPGKYGFSDWQDNVVQEGDIVSFLKFSAIEIEVNKQKYLTIKESDVIGIIKMEEQNV